MKRSRTGQFVEENVVDRFWKYVIKTEYCWLWIATGIKQRYGLFWNGGRYVGAHRYAYELLVGKIPNGLTIDHLCKNTKCVNPKHLEPVTIKENILRGDGVSARNSRKKYCKRGHLLSGDNLIKGTGSQRQCKFCKRLRYAARKR